MFNYMDWGKTNLQVLSEQDKFNDWLYGGLKPFISGKILEVGSGLGTISKRLVKDFTQQEICLSDVDDEYIRKLKAEFAGNNVSVVKLDLRAIADFELFGSRRFNTIVCSNVLEHISDDCFTLKQFYRLLVSGGRLILVVPQYQFLFNKLDEAAGHIRRYQKKELATKTERAGFIMEKMVGFNVFGIIGWFFNGGIFRREKLSPRAFAQFNALVPVLKFVEEKLFNHKIGLSIVGVFHR